MDDIVKAALTRWPGVPHCYGWLGLDARGNWYMRDDRTQAAGPFPQCKGSRIEHDQLRQFIERNYAADAEGCWFFQNGPQRVYVELEAAPYVWRIGSGQPAGSPTVQSHTGLPARVLDCWLDEAGRLYLGTDLGFGLVHSMDMGLAADAVARGAWLPIDAGFAELSARFGFELSPSRRRASRPG
jgi:hypothetical protein